MNDIKENGQQEKWKRFACTICSYAYDPKRGDPEHGIPAGTLFDALPKDWRCPWCGATKKQFIPEEDWSPADA